MLMTMPAKVEFAPDSSTENGGTAVNSCVRLTAVWFQLQLGLPEAQYQRFAKLEGGLLPPLLGHMVVLESPHALALTSRKPTTYAHSRVPDVVLIDTPSITVDDGKKPSHEPF
jgi:hypothetical protein